VSQITNPLGTFTQTYEGETGVLNEVQYPLPGMKTFLCLPENENTHKQNLPLAFILFVRILALL
jgi:hypothetical protein